MFAAVYMSGSTTVAIQMSGGGCLLWQVCWAALRQMAV